MSNLIVNSQNKAYVINGSALVLNDSIAYIRGGGSDTGPYIDTGIKPDNTMRVVVWARN